MSIAGKAVADHLEAEAAQLLDVVRMLREADGAPGGESMAESNRRALQEDRAAAEKQMKDAFNSPPVNDLHLHMDPAWAQLGGDQLGTPTLTVDGYSTSITPATTDPFDRRVNVTIEGTGPVRVTLNGRTLWDGDHKANHGPEDDHPVTTTEGALRTGGRAVLRELAKFLGTIQPDSTAESDAIARVHGSIQRREDELSRFDYSRWTK